MLTSLFGDLNPLGTSPGRSVRRPNAREGGDFAATAILESTATEVNDRGHMVDKHTRDLFIVGSPAEAIRQHMAAARADLDSATRQITLHDPARMWAGGVVKALSDASGQPIERLHLRHQSTLASIALIERTALPRRVDDPLKIYTADVRDASTEAQAIPIALMERSHLTAVIMAPMPESLFDEIVATLNAAAHGNNWHCPHLLFLLSAPVAPLASHIASVAWPTSLNVMVSTEPMTSASGVWNSVLNTWNRVKHLHQGSEARLRAPTLPGGGFPIRVGDLIIPETPVEEQASSSEDRPALTPLPEVRELGPARLVVDGLRTTIDEARVLRVLEQLMRIEGVIGSCVVDVTTGLVLGQQLAEDIDDLSLDMAAATATEVLKAHRRAARDMGGDRVDEVIVTLGRRQQILRCVNSHADLFLLVVLDKQRTNLALARFRVMDTEKLLA
jgi:predicted regulator of Ras-like GTPase activity (Roadblock/LC7/MglB family)